MHNQRGWFVPRMLGEGREKKEIDELRMEKYKNAEEYQIQRLQSIIERIIFEKMSYFRMSMRKYKCEQMPNEKMGNMAKSMIFTNIWSKLGIL